MGSGGGPARRERVAGAGQRVACAQAQLAERSRVPDRGGERGVWRAGGCQAEVEVEALQIAGAHLQRLVQPGVPTPGERVAEPSCGGVVAVN